MDRDAKGRQPAGFPVSRPGQIYEVRADFASNQATLQRIELNAWDLMRILHTFTGVRTATPATAVIGLGDIAVGMGHGCGGRRAILMVLSSGWMWFQLPQSECQERSSWRWEY